VGGRADKRERQRGNEENISRSVGLQPIEGLTKKTKQQITTNESLMMVKQNQ